MGRRYMVLIVDDDPADRNCLEQFLGGKGCAVVFAASGEDALWKLGRAKYDAVFTAIALRGMSGLELADEIQTRHAGLPVVALVDGDLAGARQRGAAIAEFLEKPLAPTQVASAVDKLLPAPSFEAGTQPEAEAAPAPAMSKALARLKSVVLFFLAPVFALGYGLALPVVWLGVLLWSGVNAKEEPRGQAEQPGGPVQPGIPRTIAMMLAALVVGVDFAVVAPLLGIGLLFSFALQAWVRLGAGDAEKSEV